MSKRRAGIPRFAVFSTLALVAGSVLIAAEPQSAGSPDGELLEPLRAGRPAPAPAGPTNGPADELRRGLSAPVDGQGRPGGTPLEGDEDLDVQLQRELGAAALSEQANPLLEVARRMRYVEGRIARRDSGRTTQRLQEQIVAGLDELIRQARKRCGRGTSAGKPLQPGSPAGQPTQGPAGTTPGEPAPATAAPRTRNGKRAGAETAPIRAIMRQLWEVALPRHQREQMMQSSPEEFLPKYEPLIEQYFRSLSEAKDDQ